MPLNNLSQITEVGIKSGISLQNAELRFNNVKKLETTGVGITAYGLVNDDKGNLRSIPQISQSSSYVLTATDAGRHVSISTGGVTVPESVFQTGDTITIYNNSGAAQTITQGTNVILRFAGSASTGNRTLYQYGLCSILCVSGVSTTFVISGAGLT